MSVNIRKLLLFTLVAILSAVVVACGTTEEATNDENDANGSEEKDQNDNAETQKDETTYTIKMASPSNPEDTMVKAFYEFKDVVEKESDGRIEVDVLHSGQLGGHADYIDGLQLGSIQAAEINTAVLSSLDDRLLIFDMPYLSNDMEHQRSVIKSGIGDDLSAVLEEKADIKIVGWLQRSSRNVYSSRGPIETADDFNGLDIRVMESPVMLKTMELLGARAVPISADERYMALQTGVVDAAENSIALILTEKEYEVTDYVSMTDHFMTPNVIAMDNNFFTSLPADLQDIVLEAGEVAGQYAFEEEQSQIATAVEELEAVGMEVNFIEDKSTFIEAVQPIYEEYEDIIGKEYFDAFLNN
ncbi:TRAP transporter substrate-binding protein [Desertibacillus haloalkaliphilus]|uniref:TRAP transporter substrate-binding protein n=1 Tax=Desertibacillus haloalkaliphilus TaxID=1328930 RepID=UPI001C25FD51|nr:TRAP transporter substrate-binding protein [Desertibacillus haloalkaliphilus]MBU8907683.1 TRAP transporter substrate-binding protein [Desertibacillus haloalkaliphilus]